MKSGIYRLLNANAKAWWYHQNLRRSGQALEARKLERQSILSAMDVIRHAVANRNHSWMSIGRGGWTVYYTPHAKLEGYGDGEPYATILRELGVLVWDSRDVDYDLAAKVALNHPMPGFPEDVERSKTKGWTGAFSYVPAVDVACAWRAVGAKVWNLDV